VVLSVVLPDDDRLLPKHVAASIKNKGVVQSVHLLVISTAKSPVYFS
jgi:hypothetical protein